MIFVIVYVHKQIRLAYSKQHVIKNVGVALSFFILLTYGMFNLAKPNSGLANPSWVCLFLTEHTKMKFVKPLFLFVFLNGHLKYSIELESEI
jgi:hypothetical protein